MKIIIIFIAIVFSGMLMQAQATTKSVAWGITSEMDAWEPSVADYKVDVSKNGSSYTIKFYNPSSWVKPMTYEVTFYKS